MENLLFTNDICECLSPDRYQYLLHIFVLKGSVEFVLNDKLYRAEGGSCIIPSIAKPLLDVKKSSDLECRCMLAKLEFVDSIRMRVKYNVKGHMDLIDNPVIRLTPSEMSQCLHNIDEIEVRASRDNHIYYEESVKRAFQLFVLDMYDIHSRNNDCAVDNIPSAQLIVKKFISMLEEGEYINHRQTSYYAERINITPGYLTEVCKNVTNRPPGYWIDIYMANEIRNLLSDLSIPISVISEKLNFNSDSYFSRYCKRVLGETPLKLRNNK